MAGLRIWGPGPIEHGFFWRSIVAVFLTETAASTFVKDYLEDTLVMDGLRSLLTPLSEGSIKNEDLADRTAKMLHGGRIICTTKQDGLFSPLWRHQSRFRERIFALQFLTNFRRRPLAMAGLRALLREKGPGPALSDKEVLAELATLLGTGELVVGFRMHLAPSYAPDADEKSPAKPVAPQATAPPPKASAREQLEEAPTFTGHDGVAQAAALKSAAESGVPFCEECTVAALTGRS